MNHALDGDAHWHKLANTTEPSVCGGDAALYYFDHLFVLFCVAFCVPDECLLLLR